MMPAFCPCFARNLPALPANTMPPLPAPPLGGRAGEGFAGFRDSFGGHDPPLIRNR